MKIACEACGAKYTIADDKVRGRRVKIRCKGCGTPIVADGQPSGGSNFPDAETDAAALESEAPVTWSVNLSETDSRTMSTEEIVAAYASGVITADAFVWKDGMGDWVPLLESELAPLLAPPAQQAAAGGARGGGMAVFTAPNQAAQVSRPAATAKVQPNTHDLFGSLDTAGSEDVATSAPSVPQAGSSAYDDGKLTGARNENSVLFSLDALKAGFSPSAPATAKSSPKAPGKSGGTAARPQQPSNPDDPFGMSAASGLMGGGALFGADNQALINAPAPPPPAAAPPPSAFAAGAMPAAYVAPKSNKLVYIVAGLSGVVIIGLLIALLSGKKSDSSATAENSAAASASAAPVAVAEKPAEEAKKEEPKPAESASAATSASAAAPSTSAATTSKPPTTTGAGAAVATKKKEDAPPPADAPPFSKASAISALTAAASSAGSCKKPGGPTGPGKATVTFAPSGRVTTATVAGGSYAGTGVGGCVASVFRRAHVPAFSGSSVTVSKSFQIN
jgi:predicted Zn finger-like uncharacterized protein